MGPHQGDIALEDSATFPAYRLLNDKLPTKKLGDISRLRIGTVTGANKFFVLSPSRAVQLGISGRYLRPIVAKFSDLKGAAFTDTDIAQLREKDRSCLLFFVPPICRNSFS